MLTVPYFVWSSIISGVLSCVLYGTALTDDVDFYLTGIFDFFFYLLAYITGKKYHLVVLDSLRLYNYAYLTACLYSEAAFNTFKG